MTDRPIVIHMFSGGLDSILAARILKDEGLEVVALHFYTGFNDTMPREIGRGYSGTWEPPEYVVEAARRLDIELLPLDVSGEEYVRMLLDPRYGYGSAANPCIDCRILLLTKAREVMEERGAILVSTGEVLGQRPMSQHKNAMNAVEKRSGLAGRLLRPLSAKLFPPTIPETGGIINRDHLYDIEGRSRKRQQELAERFGINYFPTPGGGCILTAVQFGVKFHDLLSHTGKKDVDGRLLASLLTGRHLRLESGVKLIVGRDERDNDYLEGVLGNDYWRFRARDFLGPIVFATDEPGEEDFTTIAAITARYGKGSKEASVVIVAEKGDMSREIEVVPATPDVTDRLLLTR